MRVRVKLYSDRKESPPYGNSYRPHFVIKGTILYLGNSVRISGTGGYRKNGGAVCSDIGL